MYNNIVGILSLFLSVCPIANQPKQNTNIVGIIAGKAYLAAGKKTTPVRDSIPRKNAAAHTNPPDSNVKVISLFGNRARHFQAAKIAAMIEIAVMATNGR